MAERENIQILWRGVRGRCPQCGRGALFRGWANVRESCDECGIRLKSREPDTWFVMYVSMAAITGIFLIGMMWVFPPPANKWIAGAIIAVAALAIYIVTTSMRKGLAIAIDYLLELRWSNHEGLKYRR